MREAQIRSLERAWTVGEARNDNRALDLIFDNALVYIEYGKLMTKGEYLSRIRTSNPHLQQIVNEAITVRTFGSTAIVVGIDREKDVTDGKVLLTRWRFIDTWVNKKGSWLLSCGGVRAAAEVAARSAREKGELRCGSHFLFCWSYWPPARSTPEVLHKVQQKARRKVPSKVQRNPIPTAIESSA